MVGKIYAGILVDIVRRVAGGLTDDEEGGFRAGSGCADQIFPLKQISEKALDAVHVVLIDLEKAYDRLNSEA